MLIFFAALGLAQSPWEDAVADLSSWIVEPDTTLKSSADLIVLSDHQTKFLGGQRTVVQSLTVDAQIEVSIRPIALDLFGFSTHRLLRQAVADYERHQKRPFMVIDGGDIADLACRQELSLATEIDPNSVLYTDLYTPGNHDVNHVGTFRKSTDFFGFALIWGRYKKWAWGPNCASAIDAQHAKEVEEDPKMREELAVILEKDALGTFLTAQSGVQNSEPVRFHGRSRTFHIKDGPSGRWDDSKAVLDAFWRPIDASGDHLVAHLKLSNACEGRALYGCRESGRSVVVVSAKRFYNNWWVLSLDSTDQLDINPQIPGYNSSFSRVQTALWLSLMRHIRGRQDPYKPRFILAGHFPLFDLIRKSNLTRSGMDEVFGARDVVAYVAGHTHENQIQTIGFQEQKAIARRRTIPLTNYIAGSTLDYPAQLLRLSVVENNTPNHYSTRLIAQASPLPPLPPPRPKVAAALAKYKSNLVSYRDVQAKIANWRWRRLLRSGGKAGVMRRAVTRRWRIERDDTRLVMEHQFTELVQLLEDVVTLARIDASADSLGPDPLVEHLNELLASARSRLAMWHMSLPEIERKRDWTRKPPLDLFQWRCNIKAGFVKEDAFFANNDNCMLQIQHALRRLPTEGRAFEYMANIAQQAALEERCSRTDLPQPDACEQTFELGPSFPEKL